MVAEPVDARDLKSRGSISRVGSSPTLGTPPLKLRGVAQLAARLVWDEEVLGSNPSTPTA